MKDVLSVSFQDQSVVFDKGVSVDFSDIKGLTCDFVKRVAVVHVEIKESKIDYDISMKSAYVLILMIGSSHWTNL